MTAIRVLIVDDAPQVRQDLRTVLMLAGEAEREHPADPEHPANEDHSEKKQQTIEIVGEAGDGLQAISKAEILQPEVVLMDLEMPVLDGYEATRRIKSLCPTCRVLALSVHDYEAARQKAFQAGVDDFIVKGVPMETLLQAILK
jgi:DNA-binding NarL/FixJ family response regulator